MNSDISTEKYEPIILETLQQIKIQEDVLACLGLEEFEYFAQIINNLSYDLGMVIDEYNSLLSEVILGTGAFATVYKATNLQNDTLCAIKYFKSENQYNLSQIVSEFHIQHELNKLHKEKYVLVRPPILLLQTCQTHLWNVAAELELGECTLYQFIQSEQKITHDEYMGIFYQIFDSILCMHEHNYAHRDIKPQNIVYVKEKGWLLSDFGCSQKYELNEGEYYIVGTKAFNYEEIRKQIQKLYGQQQKTNINLLKNDLYAFCLTMAMVKYPNKTVVECQQIIENQLNEVPELNQIITQLNNKQLLIVMKSLIPLQYEKTLPKFEFIQLQELDVIDNLQLKLLKCHAYLNAGKLLDINEFEKLQEQADTVFLKQQIHMMYYTQGLIKEEIQPSLIVIPDKLNKSETEILHYYLSQVGQYSKLLEIIPKCTSTRINIRLYEIWSNIQLNNYEQASQILYNIQLDQSKFTLIDMAFYYALKEIILCYTKEDFFLDMHYFFKYLTRYGSDIFEFALIIEFQILQQNILKGYYLDNQLKHLDEILKNCKIQRQINQIYYLKAKCYYQLQNVAETLSNTQILLMTINPNNMEIKEILNELIEKETDKIIIEQILFQIADSYFMQQQFHKSCGYWQELINYCTKNSPLKLVNYYYNYGQNLLLMNQYDYALIAFKQASYNKIQKKYDEQKIDIAIAQTYLQLGNTEQSVNLIIEIMNQYILGNRSAMPFIEHFKPLTNYCYLLIEKQQLKIAKTLFENMEGVLSLIPTLLDQNKRVFWLVGCQIYYQLQEYQKFKGLQEKILQFLKKQSGSQFSYNELGSTLLHLAQVNQMIKLEQIDNKNEIIKYYQEFIDLYIINEPLSLQLIQVYQELIEFCQENNHPQLNSIVECYIAYMIEHYGIENQYTQQALIILETYNNDILL